MAEEEDPAEEAAAPAPGAPDPKQDDVKPVVFIAIFIASLFALGGLDLLWGLEDNGCKMTYMFEYPVYVPVPLEAEVADRFPKYGLYVYGEGEGKPVERLQAGKFSGIPVLFIPGNSGSHKQVRSLASVALRMAIKQSEYKVHFDYFSVDLAEEHSAFYGGVLEGQVEFVSEAIAKILSLYPAKQGSPNSVVLVGHSLGGVIGKALFSLPGFPAAQVSLLVTLATPHTPVLLLDSHTDAFYRRVDAYWTQHRPAALHHVTLASIGGGLRDLQVRAGLTNDTHADLNLVSSAAASVWVSTDHRCIVWCKQLVIALNLALFDMIGPVSNQITGSAAWRRAVLHHHLVRGSGGKPYSEERHPATQSLDRDGYWSDILKRQFTVTKGNLTTDHFMMVKLTTDDPKARALTLDAVLEADDWVFGCKETVVHRNTRVCPEAENLSGGSVALPGGGRRQARHVDLLEARRAGYSHIVVAVPAGTRGARVHVDVYSQRERWVTYAVPKWINFWREFPVVETTAPGAVFYNLSLTGMENPWQAYTVKAVPVRCSALQEGEKPHYGLIRFVTPWALDTSQALLSREPNASNSVRAALQSARPLASNDTVETPEVHLFLDPACTYRVTIRAALPAMMGQLVRLHLPSVLPAAAAVLVMVLAFQLRRIEQDGTCLSPLLTLASAVSPVNVVLPSRLVAYIAALGPLAVYLPVTDIATLQARNLDFGLLPIMVFFLSIGLVLLVTLLAWGAVLLGGGLAHRALLRLAPGPPAAVEAGGSVLQRLPALLAAGLAAVALGSCGGLALAIGSLAFLLRLVAMQEEYLKSVVRAAAGLGEEDAGMLHGLYLQMTLGLLWGLASILSLPTLLAWAQAVQHGAPLPADPTLSTALILSASLAVLWQNEGKPRAGKKYFSALAVLLQAAAIFIGTFAMVTIYRVSFAISAVFVLVAGHQVAAPARGEGEVPQEAEGPLEVAGPDSDQEQEGGGEEGAGWEEVEADGGNTDSSSD